MVTAETNQSAYRCRPCCLCHGSHRTKLVCGSSAGRLHGATSFGDGEKHFAECHSVHADSSWILGWRDFRYAFFLCDRGGRGADIRGLAFRAPRRSGSRPLLARSLHVVDDPMAFWRRNSVCASRHPLDGFSGVERPTPTHCPFLPTLPCSCGLGMLAAARHSHDSSLWRDRLRPHSPEHGSSRIQCTLRRRPKNNEARRHLHLLPRTGPFSICAATCVQL